MTTEELAHRMGEASSRRGLFGKAAAAAVSATLMMLGLPDTAEGSAPGCSRYKCCCLCRVPPKSSCCSGGAYCGWSWTCCYGTYKYRCAEYDCGATGNCTSCTNGVDCSTAKVISRC